MNADNTQGGAGPSGASAGSRGGAVCDRITAYLSGGGLFNPEMANHDAVRDLLIDARAEIERLRVNLRLAGAGFTFGEPAFTEEERGILSDASEAALAYGNGYEAGVIQGILDRTKRENAESGATRHGH